MRIAMRSALFISIECCSLLLFSDDAESGTCPGEESGLAKDVYHVGPYHGDGDYIGHNLERWADYPWNWPECYWEFEDASFDARDVTEQVGPSLEYANCTETPSTTSVTISGSVTISAQLSGSVSIAGELGWKTSGTAKLGGSGSFNWEVNVSATGQPEQGRSGCA